ncbi:hypothetical protein [Lysobacter gummosus]
MNAPAASAPPTMATRNGDSDAAAFISNSRPCSGTSRDGRNRNR